MDLGGWRAMFEPKNFRGTKYSKGEKAYASWGLWEWGLNVRGSRARATPTQGDHQEGDMLMSDINETRAQKARGLPRGRGGGVRIQWSTFLTLNF